MITYQPGPCRMRPSAVRPHPISEEFVAEHQHAADPFHTNGLTQRKITVANAILPQIGDIVLQTGCPDSAIS